MDSEMQRRYFGDLSEIPRAKSWSIGPLRIDLRLWRRWQESQELKSEWLALHIAWITSRRCSMFTLSFDRADIGRPES
jgi:hypothetical protein